MGTYCQVQAVFLERGQLLLLLPVDWAVPPLVGYPPLFEKDISSARGARPPLRRSREMTRKINDCTTRVACSL